MTWRLTLFAVLGPLLLALALTTQGRADRSARDVTLAVARGDGSVMQLQFVIDARSEQEAHEAVRSAATQLFPGSPVLEDSGDGVSAAFAAWWWQWEADELPVPVLYNPAGAVPGVTDAGVTEMLDAWSTVEGSSFRFAYGGLTAAGASVQENVNDGLNVVAWAHLDCPAGCVLGVTTKTETHESDILLNSNPDAGLGDGSDGSLDTLTVLLHELGHMAGLEHSCSLFDCTPEEQDAVMYFQYRGQKRVLQPDDIAGIGALYAAGPESNVAQATTLQLAVEPGWMLTALPPGSMDEAMAKLSCVDGVFAYDGDSWQTWLRGAPAVLQELTTIEQGTAYWVHANAACSHLFVIPS